MVTPPTNLMDPLGQGHTSDYMGHIRNVIVQEGNHKVVEVCTAHDFSTAKWAMQVNCRGCEKIWRYYVDTQVRRASQTPWDVLLRKHIFPWIGDIARESCKTIVGMSLLAEWLTERLAQAGRDGVPYALLVQEAARANEKINPADVDLMLRRMGFLQEWTPVTAMLPDGVSVERKTPMIYLPAGHPLRAD